MIFNRITLARGIEIVQTSDRFAQIELTLKTGRRVLVPFMMDMSVNGHWALPGPKNLMAYISYALKAARKQPRKWMFRSPICNPYFNPVQL